jgi:hypothetical protein
MNENDQYHNEYFWQLKMTLDIDGLLSIRNNRTNQKAKERAGYEQRIFAVGMPEIVKKRC